MSRVTPPVNKLTHAIRGISSSAKAGRPSGLLDSQARHNVYLPRSLRELKGECSQRKLKTAGNKSELVERLAAYDLTRSHSTFGGHRPAPTSAAPVYKIIPLMQGFQTSAPKQSALDNSSIDFMFIPDMPEPEPLNPFARLRVPLLPDNYSPDRSSSSPNAVEALDQAVPRPEISIIAAHPENVVAAALTEVVGNAAIDVPIEDLTTGFSSTPAEEANKELGVLKELWNDLIDDLFGSKATPKTAL
ncbi:hypothetical protein PVAG01_03629 [Phlyctema vagabunda]|uniref:SAP domain-containing protein n=1 Tax=Phlyctema vagabunda TaxID=108571 RepID=A0ABR4PLZ7_9HELO